MAGPKLAPFWIWVFTVIVVLGGLIFQRVTAPSYPLEVVREVEGRTIRASLGRSSIGSEGQRVVIEGTSPDWEGDLLWRSVKTGGSFNRDPLRNLGAMRIGTIPPQARGESVEYRIELTIDHSIVRLPVQGTVITRFKGSSPAWVIVGHVLLIYCGLLFGTKAGLDALNLDNRSHLFARLSLLLFIMGGFVFGPLLKWFAYGRLWSGPPMGTDSTDIKVLALAVAWTLPVVFRLIHRQARPWILLASLLSILAFLMPHTTLGQ